MKNEAFDHYMTLELDGTFDRTEKLCIGDTIDTLDGNGKRIHHPRTVSIALQDRGKTTYEAPPSTTIFAPVI